MDSWDKNKIAMRHHMNLSYKQKWQLIIIMKLAAPGSSRCQKEKTDQNPRKYIHSVQIHLLALSSGGTGRLRNTCPFHYAFFYHKHEPQVTAEDRTQS